VFVLPFVNLVESLHLLPKVIGVREELTFVVLCLCGFLNKRGRRQAFVAS
jgi:hypothetical protein